MGLTSMEGLRYILFWLVLLLPGMAQADAVNNEWYSSLRALSMGNIGVASSDGTSEAMFYNPAALARIKRTVVEYFNLQMEFGKDIFGISENQKNYGKNTDLSSILPQLEKHPGSVSYLGASSFPNFHAENLEFGVLGKIEKWSYYDGQTLTYHSRVVIMPTLGMSLGLFGNRIKLGVAGRAIQLTENDKAVTTLKNIGYNLDAQEGFGFGVDAGVLLSLPWAMLPSLGAVARNIGGTRFISAAPWGIATGTVIRPAPLRMTIDGGFALFPKLGRTTVLTIAIDYRDILNRLGESKKRWPNVGGELAVYKTLFLRGGVSQGYWTAGIGLGAKNGTLDLGTYGEELTNHFQGKENRRFALKFGNRF